MVTFRDLRLQILNREAKNVPFAEQYMQAVHKSLIEKVQGALEPEFEALEESDSKDDFQCYFFSNAIYLANTRHYSQ